MIEEKLNQHCEDECKEVKPPYLPLWGIKYHVGTFKGVALVRAVDGPKAIELFKKDSNFNGIVHMIKIDYLAEIPETNEQGLAFEMYFDTIHPFKH